MKNNRGQTLVLFILILPIILSLLLLLINYGILSYEKLKLSNNIKQAIEYGLNLKMTNDLNSADYLTNDEIKKRVETLLKENITYDSIDITVNDMSIRITLSKKKVGIINILNIFDNQINLNYYGSITSGKIKIRGE